MPIGKLKQAIHPSRQNLFRLWLIRSIVIIALLAASAWLWFSGAVDLPWFPLLLTLAVMVLINALLLLRLSFDWPVTEKEFFTNLLLDITLLTVLLYFTGGSTNPIVSYYLIPLIISAAVLRPAHTWFIAFLSITFYTALLFYYRPLEMFAMSGHGAMSSAHFLGMWVNFGFSALLISWFVVQMAATLRKQAHTIASSREAGLRNEQIISIASIAAGTAHEMRTPLATMAVTVDEVGAEHPELKDDMRVLEQQIERCDAVLRELVSTTTEDSQMNVTSIATLMDSLLEKWSLARPETKLRYDLPEQLSRRRIRYDQSLQHALMSFLNNAADASPDFVSMRFAELPAAMLITIEDRGPGIPQEIAATLGKTYISRKQGGLGLGVLLSQASIERLGGEVSLMSAHGSGTRLEIRYPLVEDIDDG